MSGKKQDDWMKCSKCKRFFPRKLFNQHESMCIPGEKYGNTELSSKFQSGFISKGLLYGKILKTASMKNEKLLNEKRNFVILNTSTIKALGLHLGSLVSVHLNNKHIVRKIWPSSHIQLDRVGIHESVSTNFKVTDDDMVVLHGMLGISSHANKVLLASCDPSEFEISPQFLQYSSFYLENAFVYPGEVIDIPHYGQMKQFYVTSVEGDLGTYEQSIENLDEFLAKDLATLNISNSNGNISKCIDNSCDTSYSFVSNKTEVSNIDGDSMSTYYSFCDESIRQDTADNQNCSDVMLTSTPVKANQESSNNSYDISCSCCPSETVAYYITAAATKVIITQSADGKDKPEQVINEKLTYDSVGGLDKQIRTLKEMVELSIKSPHVFQSYGLTPPRGALLFGQSGTGKSLLARTVMSESGVHCITINGPDILSRYYGESEAKLRNIFLDAERNAPSIIFIDELDALCPKRDKLQNEFEKRIVATLLTLMDGLTKPSASSVFVLAASNRPDSLDSALRRPGRFEKEIEFGIPKASERADILSKLLKKIPHCLSNDEIIMFADNAHGYVGADLMAVVKEASIIALKRNLPNVSLPKSYDESEQNKQFVILIDDCKEAFQHVRPSGLREVAIDVPKVYWNDIGGNATVKQKLKQAIEWPLKHPEAFTRMNIDPPKGILMYGPPGCSKTLIAKALATESGLNFIAVKGPEIFSKWVGESEKAIRQVFHKARTAAPCVVFFDEIDAVASQRGGGDADVSNVSERVLTQLLTELDGVETLNDVTLVAATNRPDVIDKALMRPGRIDRIIYIPLPDPETRKEIFNIHLRDTPLDPGVNIDDIIAQTEGYSGAEITAICREAALAALQDDINAMNVKHEHFLQALQTVKPRISSDLVQYYKKFQEHCGIHSL
ncbi:ATPase family protein 2 homolog [Dendronephthya gigantea]|uniref:ATPase family protein 2 homolog n=1 Tax=Dendronephthya gigantea TaxID=151771 RepID=UPI00106C307E|nr:ATPase family protein 2 homolog [Dendronephthya gigantea]